MSGPRKVLHGLTAPLKERLIQESLQRRLRRSELERSAPPPAWDMQNARSAHADSIPDNWCRFDMHPDYQQLRILNEGVHSGMATGIAATPFRVAAQLLERLESTVSGDLLLDELQVAVPRDRRAQLALAAQVLGTIRLWRSAHSVL